MDGLEAQYEKAVENILAIVKSQGGNSTNIAKITVFLTEKPTQRGMADRVNKKFFLGPPAMSWIYVQELFRPDVKVEIEAIAAVP